MNHSSYYRIFLGRNMYSLKALMKITFILLDIYKMFSVHRANLLKPINASIMYYTFHEKENNSIEENKK